MGVTVLEAFVLGDSPGLPPEHRLLPLITEAMQEPLFAESWMDVSDRSFRPFAAVILESHDAQGWSRASREALYREMVSTKRGAFLSEVLGIPVAGRAIKALGRTTWQEFTRGDWDSFFSIDLGTGANRLFGHVRAITPILVRQFAEIPVEVRVTQLLNVVSQLAVPAWRWERLAGFVRLADANRHPELLRDARTLKTNGDFWDF